MMPVISLSLLGNLVQWDKWFFIKINRSWINPVFDALMPFFRDPAFWTPLYLFLAAFVLLNYRRQGLWWAVLFLCTVALTDMVSSRIFKDGFDRLRPCQDPYFYQYVRLLVKSCAGGPSFTSNHAANHFGMATFFFLTFRHRLGRWVSLAFLWAFLVAYAQVYVGVHYPLDVAGGAAIGVIFGLFTGMLFNKKIGFVTFEKQPTG